MKEVLIGAVLAVVYINMSYQLCRSPATHNAMLRLGFSVSLLIGDPCFRQILQTKVCLGHDDTSNQESSFQTLSSYMVIVLAWFHESTCCLCQWRCSSWTFVSHIYVLSLGHFVGYCGSYRVIRCDLRFKACWRLYVGQLAIFYWVLREMVAACRQ